VNAACATTLLTDKPLVEDTDKLAPEVFLPSSQAKPGEGNQCHICKTHLKHQDSLSKEHLLPHPVSGFTKRWAGSSQREGKRECRPAGETRTPSSRGEELPPTALSGEVILSPNTPPERLNRARALYGHRHLLVTRPLALGCWGSGASFHATTSMGPRSSGRNPQIKPLQFSLTRQNHNQERKACTGEKGRSHCCCGEEGCLGRPRGAERQHGRQEPGRQTRSATSFPTDSTGNPTE